MRGVAEEAPEAYKDVDAVVDSADAAGLARKVARVEPLICIKGIKAPNASSRAAMAEASQIIKSRRARFASADDLIDDIEKAGQQ
jgi:hypothetical protein